MDRDLDLQFRLANGDWDRWPAVIEEVIQLKPDIIWAGATLEAVWVRKATSTIPIVCSALANAVRLGLRASEARPGGNVTGIMPYVAGLPGKQIELAREIVPGASTVGLLTNLVGPGKLAESDHIRRKKAASFRVSAMAVPSPHARLARLFIGLYRLWVQHLIQHLLGVRQGVIVAGKS